MAADGPELLRELKDTFLAEGHQQGEWDRMFWSSHLPRWSLTWMSSDDADHSEKLAKLWQGLVSPGDLIEVEVRDDDGAATGRAIVAAMEMRVTSGQHIGKVKMICSTDSQFEDWCRLHCEELVDYEFHFCKKGPGKCSAKPRSKQVGWFHVATFRMTTVGGWRAP